MISSTINCTRVEMVVVRGYPRINPEVEVMIRW